MDVNDRVAVDVLMSKYRGDVSRGGSPHTRRRDDLDELMFEHGAQTRELSDDSRRARRSTDDQLDLSGGGSDGDETMITYVVTNQEARGRGNQSLRKTMVTSSGMDVNDRVVADVLMSKYRGDVSRGGSPHTRRTDDFDEVMFEHGAQAQSYDSRRTQRRADDVLDLSETGSDDDDDDARSMRTVSSLKVLSRDDHRGRRTFDAVRSTSTDRAAAEGPMTSYRREVSRCGLPYAQRSSDVDELIHRREPMMNELLDDGRRTHRVADDVPGLPGSVESVASAPPGAQRSAFVEHRVVTPDDHELRGRKGRPLVERSDIVAGPEGGDNWSQHSEVQVARTAVRRSMSDLPSTLPMYSHPKGGREAELEETPRAPPAYSSRGAERRCTMLFTKPATKAGAVRNSTGRCASVPVAVADETGRVIGAGSGTDVTTICTATTASV